MRTALGTLALETAKDARSALAAMASEPHPTPIAGGTDLYVTLHAGANPATRFLDLSRVKAWRGITTGRDHAVIGALTTFAAIRDDATIQRRLPALVAAAREGGAWPIQTRATLGGNIANASPAGDSLPVLLAHDATIELCSVHGEREIPYDEFHVGYRRSVREPEELITRVLVPFPRRGSSVFFRKVGTRRAQSISKVVFCGRIERDARGRVTLARLAFGSMAAMPVRARRAEEALVGRTFAAALADAVAALPADLTPIDDIRSEGVYRAEVAGRLLEQFARVATARR